MAQTVFTPVPKCSKCQSDDVSRLYHSASSGCTLSPQEHLHMSCLSCGNIWAEDPADKAV